MPATAHPRPEPEWSLYDVCILKDASLGRVLDVLRQNGYRDAAAYPPAELKFSTEAVEMIGKWLKTAPDNLVPNNPVVIAGEPDPDDLPDPANDDTVTPVDGCRSEPTTAAEALKHFCRSSRRDRFAPGFLPDGALLLQEIQWMLLWSGCKVHEHANAHGVLVHLYGKDTGSNRGRCVFVYERDLAKLMEPIDGRDTHVKPGHNIIYR